MTSRDVLVVAPYNAQVREIDSALAAAGITGVRVGTVDKFQGRQAPAVVYSMATSSADLAPRGMEFLYDRHRLNVATSRARALAIIVASPQLVRVYCRTPRQMYLANALCAAWEAWGATHRAPGTGATTFGQGRHAYNREVEDISGGETGNSLRGAIDVLFRFLGDQPLTARIGNLERDLTDADAGSIPKLLQRAEVDSRLLQAAFLARRHLGRLNDLIHACAIALALPQLLEPGERLLRPSLAAGNDRSRPFDVETDRRIAEFKLSRWQGTDAMRKRQVFKDLVHLASDNSDRRRELFVVGHQPIRFLQQSKSTAGWALDRSPRERQTFESSFGSLDRQIRAFTSAEGSRVRLIDLELALPALFQDFDQAEGWMTGSEGTEGGTQL
jgi:hypothetical protein